jgi:hypothetical protein
MHQAFDAAMEQRPSIDGCVRHLFLPKVRPSIWEHRNPGNRVMWVLTPETRLAFSF